MNAQNKSNNGGDNCRTPKPVSSSMNHDPAPRKTRAASAVAIGAAILSSACCWLPLALLGLGVSAAGLSKFIVGARWVFVTIAVAALGFGFYFSYRRKAVCAPPGEACSPGGLARFNRVMLWVSAALVLAFALFPYYSGPMIRALAGPKTLVGGVAPRGTIQTPAESAPSSAVMPPTSLWLYTYRIQGMECTACAAGLQSMVARLPGVKKAAISYRRGAAEIQARTPFDPQSVVHKLTAVGYKTTLVKRQAIAATQPCCR